MDFLLGKQESSNREGIVVYVGKEIFGVKWRNWKMVFKELESAWGTTVKNFGTPLFYDLHTDPKEENPMDPRWIGATWSGGRQVSLS